MILLANGCSWTYGGGLGLDADHLEEERIAACYPRYLGELMGAEKSVNISEGGGSNQRMVRTTYNWLRAQSEEDRQRTVAVFQLTHPPRFEYYEPKDPKNILENIDKRWARAKPGWVGQLLEPYETAVARADHRSETMTYQEETYLYLTHILALDGLMRHFKVAKYYLWTYGCAFSNYLPEVVEFYGSKRFPWLHGENEHHYSTWEYETVSAEDPHPSFLGHKQLAKIIYHHMQRLDSLNKYSL